MKHLIQTYKILSVLAVLWSSNVIATPVADSLAAMSDSERVALIFPFEVGQQYQFKASGDFLRLNGEVLPAYTVAEITITDTVINGISWLKIPYWNPFGGEIYRLDNNCIIIPDGRTILNLSSDQIWPQEDGLRIHFHYSYPGSHLIYGGGPHVDTDPIQTQGWRIACVDSIKKLIMHDGRSFPFHTWGVHAFYSFYGRGSCLHGTGHAYGINWLSKPEDEKKYTSVAKWGVFRPKSDAAWPELDPVNTTNIENDDEQESDNPSQLTLTTYPNPFNPVITIEYTLPQAGQVHMMVYNIMGQQIRTLMNNQFHTAGNHRITWNGRDNSGRNAGSGVYLINLTTQTGKVLKRVTLLR